jgi:agmatine deiminase
MVSAQSLEAEVTVGPVPAEFSPHGVLWVGFPSHADLWEDNLEPAQTEVADLVRALAGPGGERVRLLVRGEDALAAARALVGGLAGVDLIPGEFGDIWLRDTGPIFTAPGHAAAFSFNGWGGRYELPGDDTVADQIAAASGARLARHPFILEGGALDHDGKGTLLTTRQCLLNLNRNPGWSAAAAEAALAETLGARKVIWLGDGLRNDHTDGHVDNLARFLAPGVVACPLAVGLDDPNGAVYDEAAAILGAARDADGAPLRLVRIPSPGRITDEDERVIPASHMNFLIANGAVIVPLYDEVFGPMAVKALEAAFPDRVVMGLSSRALISGGGSFHCISQQEPA